MSKHAQIFHAAYVIDQKIIVLGDIKIKKYDIFCEKLQAPEKKITYLYNLISNT